MHGRAMDAGLLEQAAMDHRHDTATARGIGVVRASPVPADKAARRVLAAKLVLELFEFGAEIVAQAFEPGARRRFVFFHRGGHGPSLAKVGCKDKAICRHTSNSRGVNGRT